MNQTITIEGLNRHQRVLADILWTMNGRDQVERFINSLHGQNRRDAEIVLELMIAAVYDDVVEIQQPVKELLAQFRI